MAKKCTYCGNLYESNRRWSKFCRSTCRKNYWLEQQTIIGTTEYKLFLKWRRLIGPINEVELNRFADWRRRSLKRSLFNQKAMPAKKRVQTVNATK